MTANFAQIALALAEGFGLALSPCILPILPFILASSATANKVRPFFIIGGFVATFTIFSLISRSIIASLGIQQDTIQTGAYVLLFVFGIVMVVPWLEERFAAATGGLAGTADTLSRGKLADSTLGGFMVGGLIGLVWIPCAGPILAAAIIQVIQSQTSLDAVLTIAAFSVGAGIPMLLIALFGQYMSSHFRALSKHSVRLRRIMGGLIILFAIFALSGVNIAEWAVAKTATTRTTEQNVAGLQNGLEAPYDAPKITGIKQWLNSNSLRIADLKGKVVLIDFWTYSCINCIRTLPYVEGWYEKYKDQGLVVIGVHTPEFEFEGKPENVQKAIEKFGITYPVAMDNDFGTWKNYENRYWPAHYLIDRNGQVVYAHFGEGHYDITENNIRYLLGLNMGAGLDAGKSVSAEGQTPETYIGTNRAEREVTTQELPLHAWRVGGGWKRNGEYIQSTKSGDSLTLHFQAKKVFLVMESATGKDIGADIVLNGKPIEIQTADSINGKVAVRESRLYEIVAEPNTMDGTVTIKTEDAGLKLYAFTFES